jgi:hypothetical protein
MAKGRFTQTFCMLTDGSTTIDAVRTAVKGRGYEIVEEKPAQEKWQFGGPTLMLAYKPEQKGYIAVDVVAQPWPDPMGEPRVDRDTFAAWEAGHFGPFAFRAGLARAVQNSWAWAEGKNVAALHNGFIRIRLGYDAGAKEESRQLPENYDPVAELTELNKVVVALFHVAGVLCYFNPNGEVLRDRATFREHNKAYKDDIPLLLWVNVRLFRVNDSLVFMDTVGNDQLDVPDLEAFFAKDKYQPDDIDSYLRSVTLYLRGRTEPLGTGEEIDGPSEADNMTWTIETLQESGMPPPRRVVRLYPKTLGEEIKKALAEIGEGSGK